MPVDSGPEMIDLARHGSRFARCSGGRSHCSAKAATDSVGLPVVWRRRPAGRSATAANAAPGGSISARVAWDEYSVFRPWVGVCFRTSGSTTACGPLVVRLILPDRTNGFVPQSLPHLKDGRSPTKM